MSTRLYTAAKSTTTTRVEEIENISLSLSIWYCQYPFRASAQHTHSLSLWKKTTPFLLISFWSHPLSPLSYSTPNDIYLYSVADLSRNDIYSTRFLTQHPPNIYMSSYPYYSSTLILYALYMAYVSNNQVGGIYGFVFRPYGHCKRWPLTLSKLALLKLLTKRFTNENGRQTVSPHNPFVRINTNCAEADQKRWQKRTQTVKTLFLRPASSMMDEMV